jgi:hypothetical protein
MRTRSTLVAYSTAGPDAPGRAYLRRGVRRSVVRTVGASCRRAILRVSFVSVLVALALPTAAAHGDIGIRMVSRSVAGRGDFVTVFASGFLGPKPWRPMPVVMIPAALAPKPVRVRGGFASPRALRSQLEPPRYRVVGEIRTGVHATALASTQTAVFASACRRWQRASMSSRCSATPASEDQRAASSSTGSCVSEYAASHSPMPVR